MRIQKLHIPESISKQKNLEEINLTKKNLGSTVALIGKNGAGKTRILANVERYFEILNYENFLDNHLEYIPKEIIGGYQNNLINAKKIKDDLISKKTYSETQIAEWKSTIARLLKPILKNLKELGPSYIKVVDNDILKEINTNENLSFEQILQNKHVLISRENNSKNGTTKFHVNEFNLINSLSTINYIKNLTNQIATDEFNLYLNNKGNPELIEKEIKNKKSYQLFRLFQEYVSKFLGKEFSYKQSLVKNSVTSELHYNNQPFDVSLFSPGQKTLFAYAILFFYLDVNSETNLRDCIILIDEPEKHLHPESQILLIKALKEIVFKSGQLWIATHSVHILSQLDYNEILMVEENKIIPPSRTTPGKSFNSLMGIEEHIHNLVSFINSVSDWAYGNFMRQCFKKPEVIFSNNTQDPQFILFKRFLTNLTQTKILDFGAGKGRIGYTIKEDEELSNKVNYSALEPDEKNHELLRNIPNIYKVHKNLDEIENSIFDCVLMCNVLHEISPKKWINIFQNIKRVLKSEGYLLIIEDRYLPKGENAHEFGYLILGHEEIKKLFNSKKVLELNLNDEKYSNRIIFNVITQNDIEITDNSILNALIKLRENSFENIKKIRREESNIDQGRKFANQTQLYINSQLAIESLNLELISPKTKNNYIEKNTKGLKS